MRKNIILLAFVVLVGLTSCRMYGVRGNGNVDEEYRKLDYFEEIEVGGAFELDIRVGGEPGVVIEAESNLFEFIETRVRGDKLIIETRKNLRPREDIILKITAPDLNRLDVSGACCVNVNNIDTKIFKLDLSGAGSVTLDGNSEEFDIDLSGASSVNARNLRSDYVYLDSSGASSAEVYARKRLRASVSGVGSVEYYGNPDDIDTDISGLASITRGN